MSSNRHPALTVTSFRVTCEAAPVQIEGLLSDGREFYFRIRHTSVRLDVGVAPHTELAFTLVGPNVHPHQMSHVDMHHALALLNWLVSEINE